MIAAIVEILKFFDFPSHLDLLAPVSLLYLLITFGGGIAAGLFRAFGPPRPPRKTTELLSFRLLLSLDALIAAFALIYHAFWIETMTGTHLLYWAVLLAWGALLGMIGMQVMATLFKAQVEANAQAWRAYELETDPVKRGLDEARRKIALVDETKAPGGPQRTAPGKPPTSGKRNSPGGSSPPRGG